MRAVVVLVTAGALALAAGLAATADPRAELDRIAEQVAEAEATLEHATDRARDAAAKYAAADAALPAAEDRLGQARGELAAAQVHADSAERAAQQAEQDLRAASGQVEASAQAVDEAREGVATFARAAYRGSRLAPIQVMLRADGPAEAVERLGYLNHISGLERAALDEFSGARLRARHFENQASLAAGRAESTRSQAAAALSAAEAAERAATAAATEAENLVRQRAAALAVAEEEREASLQRYEQVQAESERIETEVREWEARQAAPAAASGPALPQPDNSGEAPLMMPTQGWLSSQFGMRHDPFFGVSQLHAGMDIAAAGGSPIYAAASGTVIRAGWNGGYGNFTCLGHGTHQGQGLATCYAHQSEILVSEGQRVSRGDLIGRVGTTGASTGDHLHFEVRLDGSPTDPIGFLPPCLCGD